jgi:hypothetical protein
MSIELDDQDEIRSMISMAKAGYGVEIVIGRFFEVDDGSINLTKEEADVVLRMLQLIRARAPEQP